MARALSYAAALGIAAVMVVAGAIGGLLAAVFGSSEHPAGASADALSDISPEYLVLYQRSAQLCPGLDWTVLAAIGKIESDHGRSPLPGVRSGHNGVHGPTEGAMGPMQFMLGTWRAVRAAHPEIGPNVYRPENAIPAAVHHLCDSGAPTNMRRAIFAYNHADWYVDKVLAQAEQYRSVPAPNRPGQLRLEWPPERATMPDPTTSGRITPRTYTLVRSLQRHGLTGNGIACFGHRPNPASDHPKGKACDIFVDPHDPASVAEGWRIVNWLIDHQADYGLHYVIYQGRFWSALDPQWVPYHSDPYGCPNPANLTGCHYDHLHWSGL